MLVDDDQAAGADLAGQVDAHLRQLGAQRSDLLPQRGYVGAVLRGGHDVPLRLKRIDAPFSLAKVLVVRHHLQRSVPSR
ncbi:MAG: hypothetical protein H0W46_07065 [Acidimicrobiia bacterium]|nr:hypothetical protein [Acidimicrobiia bacterium]